MIYRVILFSAGLFLITCARDNKAVNIFIGNGITLVDSASTGTELLNGLGQYNNISYYPVYYIGPETDTLCLGRQPISMFSDMKENMKYDTAKNWNSHLSMEINIYVDTTMRISHNVPFTHFDEQDLQILDSVKFYKAFPVFIKNKSDSLIHLGTHNFVAYLIREAKDENGNWIAIEITNKGLCDTAKRELIIEPDQIMVAKLIRYGGDIKTECRLKFEILWGKRIAYQTYSNVFLDSINKKQFKTLN